MRLSLRVLASAVVLGPSLLGFVQARATPRFAAAWTDHILASYPEHTAIADLDEDGIPDLAAARPIGDLQLLKGFGDGTFTLSGTLAGSAHGVAVADLDGDGHLDLVVVGSGLTSVYLGNGDLTFDPPLQYGSGVDSGDRLTIADVTGDMILDVVTPDSSLTLHVRPGLGDGTLGPPTLLPTTATVRGVVTGDFDGNGHRDIAASMGSSSGPTSQYEVAVYLNLGGGVFAAPVMYTAPEEGIDTGRIDADLHLDLVAGSSWFRGHGDGAFDPGVPFGPAGEENPVIADLDGDGQLDVVTELSTGPSGLEGYLAVYLGDGAGSFAAPVWYRTGTGVNSTTTGDLNGDGEVDIVASCSSFSRIVIHLGVGDGTFPTPANVAMPSDPVDVEIAEVTGDANADLLGLGNVAAVVRVLPGAGDGTFGLPMDLVTPPDPRRMALGDVDGDGILDLVTANGASNSVSVFPGTGAGFGARVDYPMNAAAIDVVVHDMNGDTIGDVVALGSPGTVSIFQGQNGAGLGARMDVSGATNSTRLFAGRVNADAFRDVILFSPDPYKQWWIFVGLAGGAVAAPTSIPVALHQATTAGTALASDINDDGFLDLITTGLDRDLVVQMGQGDGTFATLPVQGLGSAPRRCRALAIGHLDEDGHVDLFTGNWIAGSGSVLYGDGVGVFQLEYGYGSDGWPSEVALGDLDGNGRLDAVVANETRSDVTILLDYQIQTASAPRPAGGQPTLAFARVWPVPARGGALHATVALPARGEARLDLLDVAGRSVAGRPLGVIDAGTRQVSLELPGDLRPGVYWLRLTHGGHAAAARVAVLR